MSASLVKRWRRLSRAWDITAAGIRMSQGSIVEIADCHARADVFGDCAKSLELSMKRAKRRKAKP